MEVLGIAIGAGLAVGLSALGTGYAQARIGDRLRQLATAIDAAPKSFRWRARERVGRRVRWYRVVEEVL